MNPEMLLYTLVDLFELLDVPYFVTGSVAAMTYGEPRLTLDVDIVAELREEHAPAFCETFAPPDYYVSQETVRAAIRAHRQFNVLHITEGVKAEIIIPKNTEFNQSRLGRRRPQQIGSRDDVIVASPEDVILKKMEYFQEGGSEKHLRDILSMLKISSSLIDQEYIALWAVKLDVRDVWQMILEQLHTPPKADS
jgi:hypothetical protein